MNEVKVLVYNEEEGMAQRGGEKTKDTQKITWRIV